MCACEAESSVRAERGSFLLCASERDSRCTHVLYVTLPPRYHTWQGVSCVTVGCWSRLLMCVSLLTVEREPVVPLSVDSSQRIKRVYVDHGRHNRDGLSGLRHLSIYGVCTYATRIRIDRRGRTSDHILTSAASPSHKPTECQSVCRRGTLDYRVNQAVVIRIPIPCFHKKKTGKKRGTGTEQAQNA